MTRHADDRKHPGCEVSELKQRSYYTPAKEPGPFLRQDDVSVVMGTQEASWLQRVGIKYKSSPGRRKGLGCEGTKL